MLACCWLVGGLVFFYCKIQTKKLTGFFYWQLTDYMAGGSPLCLAGRWSVDWFWQRDWQNVGGLLVGGWLGVFLLQNSAYKTDGFFLTVDWLHGWRLPSLLSWSVVGWLVLAKRLTEYWRTVGWWWLSVFLLQKSDYKTDRFFLAVDWQHGWRLPSLLSWLWSVDWFWQRDRQNVSWLLIGGWLSVFYCKMKTK